MNAVHPRANTPAKTPASPDPLPLTSVPNIPEGEEFLNPSVNVPSIMVMGPSGTGKTDSIITLLESGLKVFVLSTEGNGVEILLDSFHRRKKTNPNLSMENLHWRRILPATLNISAMIAKARISNSMGVGDMQKLEGKLERGKYAQFLNFLKAMQNLECERTGKTFGNISHLDHSWAVVVDSLSGLNIMIAQHVTGHRPTMTQPEFGVCQGHIKDLINFFTSLPCFFVLTAHVDRETNFVTGQERITASTLGKALVPIIPQYFSEIVYTKIAGDKYRWSTLEPTVDVKHRALSRSAELEPDFTPIVQTYYNRIKQSGGEPTE